MANTYTQLYIQMVFAVQNRSCYIGKEWETELYKYITGIVQNNNHKLIAINGVANHIHIFIGYKPHQLIPDLLQDIKGSSSKCLPAGQAGINEKGFIKYKFSWQVGYGAFSYSHSQISGVAKYIKNQKIHHKKVTFKEEYKRFLQKFNVSYDEKYILKDV